MSLAWQILGATVSGLVASALFATGQTAKSQTSLSKPTRSPARGSDPLPTGASVRLGTSHFRSLFPDFALAPDGNRLALRNYHSIDIWDVRTGKKTCRIQGEDEYVDLEMIGFSRDGARLATHEEGTVRLWNATTGRKIWELPDADTANVSGLFTADGKHFLSWSTGRTAGVWDVASGKPIRALPLPKGMTYRDAVISGDGRVIAAQIARQSLRLWDVTTGNISHTIRQPEPVELLRLSENGQKLAAIRHEGKTIRIYSTTSAKEVTVSLSGRAYSKTLMLSDDARLVAVEIERQGIHVWDAATGMHLHTIAGGPGVEDFLFSPGGGLLAVRDKESIRLWEIGKQQMSDRLVARVAAGGPLAFSADGKTLIAKDGKAVRLWDVRSGKERFQDAWHKDFVGHLTFSPDGALLATGGADGEARVWKKTGQPVGRIPRRPDAVSGISLSAAGKTLIYYGQDEKIWLWDATNGNELRHFGAGLPRARLLGISGLLAILSADGKTVAVTTVAPPLNAAPQVSLRDLASDKRRVVATRLSQVDGMTFSCDGTALAVSGRSSQDGNAAAIEIWDVATDRRTHRLVAEGGPRMAFSCDGKILAAVKDQTIALWEIATSKTIRTVTLPTNPGAVRVTPTGRVLALEGAPAIESPIETVDLWDVIDRKKLHRFQVPGHSFVGQALAPDGSVLATALNDTTVLLWDLSRYGRAKPSAPLGEKELKHFWAGLADPSPLNGFQAILAFKNAGDSAALFFKQNLRPVTGIDPDTVRQLIRDLDSKRFIVRKNATKELERLAELAAPALQDVLAGKPTPETRMRIEGLLKKRVGVALAPDVLRGLRAVQALEYMASGSARRLLAELAQGAADAVLTRDARGALRRLAGQPPSTR